MILFSLWKYIISYYSSYLNVNVPSMKCTGTEIKRQSNLTRQRWLQGGRKGGEYGGETGGRLWLDSAANHKR